MKCYECGVTLTSENTVPGKEYICKECKNFQMKERSVGLKGRYVCVDCKQSYFVDRKQCSWCGGEIIPVKRDGLFRLCV